MNQELIVTDETFNGLLKQAFGAGASDLHVTVNSPPVLRIDGSLRALGEELLSPSTLERIVQELMSPAQYKKFAEQGELDFSYGLPGISRFRINVFRQRGSISIAARVISPLVPAFETLNLPPVLLKLAQKPQGLFLVTGPTGSGKSTTLASLIDHINHTQRKHIVTLEDPIEYLHRHDKSIINQREVGLDTLSFDNGLRAALRQDPDIILVGEMRDPETIRTAITAAETGHLVFATLHTADAPQTIDRIIDAFPPAQQGQIRIQLASVLLAILSQRLLPSRSGKGRVCATELLLNPPAVGNLIRSEKVHQIKSVMQTNFQLGMHTLEMSLRELLRQGAVDEASARPYLTESSL
ncbi:type IV pilus twitching motility protein PilT [Paenibacillus timonensis]|uniref:Type IV pilus twitching motility protein PilT n=1 Tax=Paenibacillus timonensis TaxID=225915 RepID=A0ABW3SAT8_9BACL|nr:MULTISPECIES: type IV pilus twitching motility protein PilT [Paenibacillus]MCH1640289.1 type IV pilus twitching motility protein PilT [Paenibacillus timonensis]MDU2239122.1 type IV pilus twitching motility protein PilT [Paenibacillus sp.]